MIQAAGAEAVMHCEWRHEVQLSRFKPELAAVMSHNPVAIENEPEPGERTYHLPVTPPTARQSALNRQHFKIQRRENFLIKDGHGVTTGQTSWFDGVILAKKSSGNKYAHRQRDTILEPYVQPRPLIRPFGL